MVKIIVYGNKTATCTQRIMILLEELNIKYHFENIDLMKGEHKTHSFISMQPFGKIPAVKYGQRTLFESRAILRYIAKNNIKFTDLTNNDNYQVDMWLEAESQNFNPPISKIVYEKVFKKWLKKEEDTEVVSNSLEELKTVLSVYEKRLSKNKYIAGSRFSIADISHIPYTNYLFRCGCGYDEMIKTEYPIFYEWYSRIASRPSVQKILFYTYSQNI